VTRPSLMQRLDAWLEQPVLRLEIIRMFTPLAVLGFMSTRIMHADEWLGEAGFRVPDLGGDDWRQPLYVPALPNWAAFSVAAVMVGAGLALSIGWRARSAALTFAATLAFVALSDRLAAFTVSKISPVIMLALALSPCGRRLSFDAWRARRRNTPLLQVERDTGAVRFFQVFLPVVYSASGIAKLSGDWLVSPYVLWSYLHDSYQTWVSWAVSNTLPPFGWTLLQGATLVFEVGAPLWFAWSKTRPAAFYAGVAMHATIGLLFGPVKWFALLMIALLVGAYAPERQLERLVERTPAGWR
jgi:uncharacterized membrane protein YphA (DoxX/SURF4 family)